MWRTLVAAAVIGTACLPGDSATSQKISGQSASPPGSVQSRSPNVVGGADREPIELPRYSEGTAVIDAIVAAGFDIDKIADSYQKPFRVSVPRSSSWPRARLPFPGFAVGDRSFVMTSELAIQAALVARLRLTAPNC